MTRTTSTTRSNPRRILRSAAVVLPAAALLAGTLQQCAPAPPEPAPVPSPPQGVSFAEDFADPTAFYSRFDHGWSGEVQAGALNHDSINDWVADHDMACGNPNQSSRHIHVSAPAGEPGAPAGSLKDVEQAFYPCVPGGDPSKAHVMTSVNTSGYVAAWFSPKQTFTNVHRVCWDQNTSDEGGGRWVVVNFLTQAEVARKVNGQTDLGYLSFDDTGTPQGGGQYGVKVFRETMTSYSGGQRSNGELSGAMTDDKGPRFQHCVQDNDNGTLTLSVVQPDGTTRRTTVSGSIPNEPIRVELADVSYNPDKHFDFSGNAGPNHTYTWHWDNVQVG